MLASYNGHEEIVIYLLGAAANRYVQDGVSCNLNPVCLSFTGVLLLSNHFSGEKLPYLKPFRLEMKLSLSA